MIIWGKRGGSSKSRKLSQIEFVSSSMDIIDDEMIAQLMKSPVEEEIDCGVAFKGVGGTGTPTPP